MHETNLDICICDPFVLSGLLPGLATAMLKRALSDAGYRSRIFYPGVRFFFNNRPQKGELLLALNDDIPLQFLNFFFTAETEEAFIKNVSSHLRIVCVEPEIKNQLVQYYSSIRKETNRLIDDITYFKPRIFCFSMTFGAEFGRFLFKRLKRNCPEITIIVGGSGFEPNSATDMLGKCPEIDYILCDESTDSLVHLVDKIIKGSGSIDSCVCSRSHPATIRHELSDMDSLPFPDFSDYLELTDSMGIERRQITLPLETSRGCWWCQRAPCKMCGFFGLRKWYISKSASRITQEIRYVHEKYDVAKYRFADLVQPPKKIIEEMMPLRSLNLKFFWELRPDISKEELEIIRSIGMTSAQIGLESLSTKALEHMNKGTDSIQNIFVLKMADALKIDVIWNYLYGLPAEQPEWVYKAIEIIPLLYHLQPPFPRRAWSNKYSNWYDEKSGHEVIVTYNVQSAELEQAYNLLVGKIREWQNAFRQGTRLSINRKCTTHFQIVREGHGTRVYNLSVDEARLYVFFDEPHSLEEIPISMGSHEFVQGVLKKFCDDGLMLFLDNKYLSLATDSTCYRWTRPEDQVLHFRLKENKNEL